MQGLSEMHQIQRRSTFNAAKWMIGLVALAGCGTISPMGGGCIPGAGTGTVSDGTLHGIDGWDVSATVDLEPNSGPFGTDVTARVVFSRGAANVASIELEDHGGTSCTLVNTWRNVFVRVNSSRWDMSSGELFLTGNSGFGRFVAKNSGGTRIAIGDIRINNGCSNSSRVAIPDPVAEGEIGVFTNTNPPDVAP